MKKLDLVVVGSIGIDTIETPWSKQEGILGGSVSYACAGASFFAGTGMVGVVGEDFPAQNIDLYRRFGIDIGGLEHKPGKTFRWSGVYSEDMNHRQTLLTELNVFAEFSPKLPAEYRHVPFLFLANIAPALQLHVLSQMKSVQFVAMDTMDLWINIARDQLLEVIAAVNLVTLNESEARLLASEHNLIKAAKKIRGWGPTYVLIKKGEHGAMLFGPDGIALIPAVPLSEVIDPTGAGDVFAGGLMGFLARHQEVTAPLLRHAMVRGAVMASFGVEAFGLNQLQHLTHPEIERRVADFEQMIRIV
jgi:sugar/nucleoside kinase (ribokinase family)